MDDSEACANQCLIHYLWLVGLLRHCRPYCSLMQTLKGGLAVISCIIYVKLKTKGNAFDMLKVLLICSGFMKTLCICALIFVQIVK